MIKALEIANPGSCLNRAKDHERIFVLLQRDEAAPFAIRAWAEARVKMGKNKPDDTQIIEALTCAQEMEATFECFRCGWKGPYIKASEHPDEPPCCPMCG